MRNALNKFICVYNIYFFFHSSTNLIITVES